MEAVSDETPDLDAIRRRLPDISREDMSRTEQDRADLLAEVDRLHSWDGLMSLLDEHWPVDVFPTTADREDRDTGPRIVSLVRQLAASRDTVARLTNEILDRDGFPPSEALSRFWACLVHPVCDGLAPSCAIVAKQRCNVAVGPLGDPYYHCALPERHDGSHKHLRA